MPKRNMHIVHQKACMWMIILVLPIMPKLEISSHLIEWCGKFVRINFYTAMSVNEAWQHTKRMNLLSLILSERSQIKMNIYCIIPLCDLKK